MQVNQKFIEAVSDGSYVLGAKEKWESLFNVMSGRADLRYEYAKESKLAELDPTGLKTGVEKQKAELLAEIYALNAKDKALGELQKKFRDNEITDSLIGSVKGKRNLIEKRIKEVAKEYIGLVRAQEKAAQTAVRGKAEIASKVAYNSGGKGLKGGGKVPRVSAGLYRR